MANNSRHLQCDVSAFLIGDAMEIKRDSYLEQLKIRKDRLIAL